MTLPEYQHKDPWTDLRFNDAAHASTSRCPSHNAISTVLTEQAANHCIVMTAEPRNIPLAQADKREKGHLVTLASGLLNKQDYLDPSRSFSQCSRLVIDFTLGHTYDHHHSLNNGVHPGNLGGIQGSALQDQI